MYVGTRPKTQFFCEIHFEVVVDPSNQPDMPPYDCTTCIRPVPHSLPPHTLWGLLDTMTITKILTRSYKKYNCVLNCYLL